MDEIVRSFPHGDQVVIETEIADFPLDLREIQTLGILLNELLTNAMKYAFAGMAVGRILVKAEADDRKVTLVVQDNGAGMSPPDADTSQGFGLRLVEMLTQNLGGTARFENDHGTRVVLEFPV